MLRTSPLRARRYVFWLRRSAKWIWILTPAGWRGRAGNTARRRAAKSIFSLSMHPDKRAKRASLGRCSFVRVLVGKKIDSSRRPPNAPFMPTLPLHAEVTVSDSRDSKLLVWRLRRQYRLAALLWRSSGGRYFACKSGAICPKGCALTRSSLACDVGTPWQAARWPLWKACHRAHSAER